MTGRLENSDHSSFYNQALKYELVQKNTIHSISFGIVFINCKKINQSLVEIFNNYFAEDMDKTHLQREFKSLFDSSECKVSEFEYEKFESRKELLIQLSEVENSSMAVFDMNKKNTFLFVQNSIHKYAIH